MTRVGVFPAASFRSWASWAAVQGLPLFAGVLAMMFPFRGLGSLLLGCGYNLRDFGGDFIEGAV